MAYEAGLAGVDEGLGREPLPHERARGAVVDGVDEAADVVVDWTVARSARVVRPRLGPGGGDGARVPRNWSSLVGQPCWRAMTYAMVWLPLLGGRH